jgi:putative tricarboxylic transport membrane protein
LILLFCLIGFYSMNGNVFDIYVMLFCGVAGYVLRKLNYEAAPLVLAYVLGPMLEQNLRQALILSDGRLAVFFTRPLSAACLAASPLLLLSAALPSPQQKRKKVAVGEWGKIDSRFCD